MNPTKLYAAIYIDEGPKGPCGQDCRTTSCWTKVFLFDEEYQLLEWLKTWEMPNRRRGRIEICGPACSGFNFPVMQHATK